jgi:uncharacterized protein
MSEKNKEIVRQVDAAFGENNLEGFLEHCDEKIIWTIPGDRVVKGKDGIRQFMSEMKGAEPPKITNTNTIAEGNLVAANGEMTMKEGEKNVKYAYCDVYHFDGDKIVELNSYVVKNEAK